MKLEIGKKYRDREGNMHFIFKNKMFDKLFPFMDQNGIEYTIDGVTNNDDFKNFYSNQLIDEILDVIGSDLLVYDSSLIEIQVNVKLNNIYIYQKNSNSSIQINFKEKLKLYGLNNLEIIIK